MRAYRRFHLSIGFVHRPLHCRRGYSLTRVRAVVCFTGHAVRKRDGLTLDVVHTFRCFTLHIGSVRGPLSWRHGCSLRRSAPHHALFRLVTLGPDG